MSSASSEWHLILAVLSTVTLFSFPWLYLKALRVAKRSRPAAQKRIWLMGELMLALSLILVFVASLSSLLVTRDIIAPWLWEVDTDVVSLDSNLTPRLFFFWGTVLASGWFVFAGIGMNSVRDLHKAIKECHDLVLKNRQIELRRATSGKSS